MNNYLNLNNAWNVYISPSFIRVRRLITCINSPSLSPPTPSPAAVMLAAQSKCQWSLADLSRCFPEAHKTGGAVDLSAITPVWKVAGVFSPLCNLDDSVVKIVVQRMVSLPPPYRCAGLSYITHIPDFVLLYWVAIYSPLESCITTSQIMGECQSADSA